MSASSPVLSVRITPAERDLLEVAAEQAHTSLSDFVRRKAIEAAEIDVLGRSVVTIPAADWERFELWLKAPAKEVPGLRSLADSRPVWEG
jgi:uncharacterized protein (DUF1778 family)